MSNSMICKSTLTVVLAVGLLFGFAFSAMSVELTTFPTKNKTTKSYTDTKAISERKGSISKKCEGSATPEGGAIKRDSLEQSGGIIEPVIDR
ncbi:MAG: hypothetical protein ABW076_04970 [Candidatus Thiodiazotropha sp.]